MERKSPIHMKEGQKMLDIAREAKSRIDIRAWDSKGNVILYKGWLVSSSNWKGGWHRIINPVNNEIRTVPDIFIFEINGHTIYL